MYSTPYAHLAARAVTAEYVNSARADAPVVVRPGRRRRPARQASAHPLRVDQGRVIHAPVRRARAAVALALHQLGDAVAPRPTHSCTPCVTAG